MHQSGASDSPGPEKPECEPEFEPAEFEPAVAPECVTSGVPRDPSEGVTGASEVLLRAPGDVRHPRELILGVSRTNMHASSFSSHGGVP